MTAQLLIPILVTIFGLDIQILNAFLLKYSSYDRNLLLNYKSAMVLSQDKSDKHVTTPYTSEQIVHHIY